MLVPEIAAMLSGRSYIFDDKKFDTKLRRRCMAKNKLFDFLSNEQKAYLLSQECLQLGDEFRNTMLDSQIGNRSVSTMAGRDEGGPSDSLLERAL